MEIKLNNVSTKQFKNAGRLLVKAAELGMDVTGYGFIDYNSSHGNTFLWLENYGFSLYISDFEPKIKALYSCGYDGEETERNVGNSLDKLEAWALRLSDKSERKEGN